MSYNPQNPNGQATSANSAPVVIASDQSVVQVADAITENVIQQLVDLLGKVFPSQYAVPYARDASDQMRVVIASGSSSVSSLQWGTANAEPVYYNTGGPNSMDAREQQEEVSVANFNSIRQSRWVFS